MTDQEYKDMQKLLHVSALTLKTIHNKYPDVIQMKEWIDWCIVAGSLDVTYKLNVFSDVDDKKALIMRKEPVCL